MFNQRCLSLAAIVLSVLIGCSDDPPPTVSMRVIPSTKKVLAGPNASIEVVITAQRYGAPVLDEDTISVEIDAGSFTKDDESLTTDVTFKGGEARVKVYAKQPTVVNIMAFITDAAQQKGSAKETLSFVLPVVKKLDFTCDAFNVGAFIGAEPMVVKCRTNAKTAENIAVPNAPVGTRCEAGEMKSQGLDPVSGEERIYLYDPRVGTPLPRDVEPFGTEADGEPRRANGNKISNPRDGLVTCIAWVEGDNEGLSSDPYLDKDDSGNYNASQDGAFEDLAPKDGKYDSSQDKYIWSTVKFLWTGPLSLDTSSVSAPNKDFSLAGVKATAPKILTFALFDGNFNPLAAHGTGDTIAWSLSEGVGRGATYLDQAPLIRNAKGIKFDSKWQILSKDSRSSYQQDATYTLGLWNSSKPDDEPPPNPYTVFGNISRSYGLDESGTASGSLSEVTPIASGALPKN